MKFLLSVILIAGLWWALQFIPHQPSAPATAAPAVDYSEVNRQLEQLKAQAAENTETTSAMLHELGVTDEKNVVDYQVISPMQTITRKTNEAVQATQSSFSSANTAIQTTAATLAQTITRLNTTASTLVGLFTAYLVILRILRLWPALRFAATMGRRTGTALIVVLSLISLAAHLAGIPAFAWHALIFLAIELFAAGLVGLLIIDMNYPWKKPLFTTTIIPVAALLTSMLKPLIGS